MQKQIMSTFWRRWVVLASTACVVVSLAACDVTQTKEAELPDVDVDVKAGQMPEYEVETADIDVEKKTVEVPYPSLDIEMPGEEEEAREKATKIQAGAAEERAEVTEGRAEEKAAQN